MTQQIFGPMDFQGVNLPINLPTPVNAGDAANKAYVDSAIEGLAWKDSARVATQGNINLAAPGATLDGVTMAQGDRVLVRGQTNPEENGLYIYDTATTAMVRALDANTADELEQATVSVEEGTDAGLTFRQSAVNFTLDTDPVTWTTFGSATPIATTTTSGTVTLATQTEVDTNAVAAADKVVTVSTLNTLLDATTAGFCQNIGDTSATLFPITHNLGTRQLDVTLRRNVAPFDKVIPGCVEYTDDNNVAITMIPAVGTNEFEVMIERVNC